MAEGTEDEGFGEAPSLWQSQSSGKILKAQVYSIL